MEHQTNPNQHSALAAGSSAGRENFDPNLFIQKGVYDAQMEDMRTRLTAIENRVKDHTAFAATMKDGFEHSKDMDAVLCAAIIKLLTTDSDTKKAFKKAVKDADREWWQKHWKKAATVIGAIVLLAIGAFLNSIANDIFGDSSKTPSATQSQR